MPVEPKLSAPGRAFAAAVRSATDLIGESDRTTSTYMKV